MVFKAFFLVFCLFFFGEGEVLRRYEALEKKCAFTLSSYKKALFGWKHLENCPETRFFFFSRQQSVTSTSEKRRTVIDLLFLLLCSGFVNNVQYTQMSQVVANAVFYTFGILIHLFIN